MASFGRPRVLGSIVPCASTPSPNPLPQGEGENLPQPLRYPDAYGDKQAMTVESHCLRTLA